jgi:hAT family C-terminal dimerisation region
MISIGEITFGIVEERGLDIDASSPFKKCNLADFIDKTGYFDLVKFLGFNQLSFPYLYKLGCCLASMRTNEVGCERFFSIAGYVSNPRRTRLKVRHYEAIAMLKQNMHNVYVNEEWVVQQYKDLEKSKTWESNEERNEQLLAALEEEVYASDQGVPVESLDSFPYAATTSE